MLLLKPFTEDHGRSMVHLAIPPRYFHCASKVCHLTTRICVRLLGPCFKTGWLKPFVPASSGRRSSAPRVTTLRHAKPGGCHNGSTPHKRPVAMRALCASVSAQGFTAPISPRDQQRHSPPARTDADQHAGIVQARTSPGPGTPTRMICSNHFSS